MNEKGNVLAAIRGEFSTRSVGRALREQWSDYDLAKRDKLKGGTALMAEVDHDDELEALLADDLDQEFELLGHDEKEAFLVEQERIEEAYAAIQQQKATLKEARWKQRQIRLGRNFFPRSHTSRAAALQQVRLPVLDHLSNASNAKVPTSWLIALFVARKPGSPRRRLRLPL